MPCSWKFINNAKCYSQRDIQGGGISAAKVVNRLVVRSTGLWQKCYYRSPQQVRRVSGGWRCEAQASIVGGVVAGGFHEGARRHQLESWHPSTRQPPRHRDHDSPVGIVTPPPPHPLPVPLSRVRDVTTGRQFSCSATAEEYGAVVSCARASEPLSIVNTATSEDGKNNNSVLVTRETEPWIPTVWSGWGLQSEEQFLWPLRRQLRSPPPSSVATPWTCKLTEPWPCARVWTQSTLSLERKR